MQEERKGERRRQRRKQVRIGKRCMKKGKEREGGREGSKFFQPGITNLFLFLVDRCGKARKVSNCFSCFVIFTHSLGS